MVLKDGWQKVILNIGEVARHARLNKATGFSHIGRKDIVALEGITESRTDVLRQCTQCNRVAGSH